MFKYVGVMDTSDGTDCGTALVYVCAIVMKVVGTACTSGCNGGLNGQIGGWGPCPCQCPTTGCSCSR